MKISDIRIMCVTIPPERPVTFATRTVTKRDYTIAKIITDNGLEGVGVVGFGVSMHVKNIIERQLKVHLIGQDPLAFERIWERMYREVYRDRKGLPIVALSAADTAVWDLIGKFLKQPIHRLLGGSRDRVPCYASGGYYREGEGVKELRKRILELTQAEARKLGIGKSTLHYLRRNVTSDRSFEVYNEIRRKIGEVRACS